MSRYSTLAVLFVLGASSAALAQNSPAPDSDSSMSSSSNASSGSAPSSEKISAQDPKMKKCISAQKAKNNGLSDDQIKQKCMAHVMSHQDKGQQQAQ